MCEEQDSQEASVVVCLYKFKHVMSLVESNCVYEPFGTSAKSVFDVKA